METLPMEIIVHILKYLNKKEQIEVSRVNTKFREAVFLPSLWTEYEKQMIISATKVKSFTKFLRQAPGIRHLNILLSEEEEPKLILPLVNLSTVFKSLNCLKCLTLNFHECNPGIINFPSSLKHISLTNFTGELEVENVDDLFVSLADCCPQLEFIYIKVSFDNCPIFSHRGLCYLLEKVNKTLQTLILFSFNTSEEELVSYLFKLLNCPNLTTLCLYLPFTVSEEPTILSLPNFEYLQILLLKNDGVCRNFSHILGNCSLKNLRVLCLCNFFLRKEDFDQKISKIPNLQMLFLLSCDVDVDLLIKFARGCSSLKVLVWYEVDIYCFSKRTRLKFKKLMKDTSVKVILDYIFPLYYSGFNDFPYENILKTFTDFFQYMAIYDSDAPIKSCCAPIIGEIKTYKY